MKRGHRSAGREAICGYARGGRVVKPYDRAIAVPKPQGAPPVPRMSALDIPGLKLPKPTYGPRKGR
jgi:hypothetical protein